MPFRPILKRFGPRVRRLSPLVMEFVLFLAENEKTTTKARRHEIFSRDLFFRAFVSLRAFVIILLFWFCLSRLGHVTNRRAL